MVDLKNAKIYKIVCNESGKVYYGSTCEKTIQHRLQTHLNNYRQYLQGKRGFISSFDILQNETYEIFLIESVECSTKKELLLREKYFILNNECININIPLRTRKEYVGDNKGLIQQINKKTYEKYKESRKEKNLEYAELHREEKNEYAKEYRKRNKEMVRLKDKLRSKEKREKMKLAKSLNINGLI